MRWGKRGAGGGGGGGGGGDPMQMISMVLMIISLVIGMMGQCKEEEKKPKDIFEGEKLLPGPTIVTKTCNDLGGFSCNPEKEECLGTKLPVSDNTKNSVCYSDKPRPQKEEPETTEGKGDKTKTCAAQKGTNCGVDRYCPDNQWVPAKDTMMCCQVTCVTRIQTTATYSGLGEVVIEQFDGKSIGVWYGDDPPTKAFDANAGFRAIGHPNFAQARTIGKNKYEFSVEGKIYAFTVTKEGAGEIGVVTG